jgi:hypothetical protein
MNAGVKLVGLALITAPILAIAQGQSKPTKVNCDSFLYSEKFLARFPKGPAACQEVKTQNGEKWVHFEGSITAKEGNEVTTSFVDDFNNPVVTVTVTAADARQSVLINGQDGKWADIKVGEKISLWMPQSKIGFYAKPGSMDKGQLTITKGL